MKLKLPIGRSSAWVLLALVVLALLLDFLFFTGYYASDDRYYIAAARAIAGDGKFMAELGSVRLGITLPSAAVYWMTNSIASIIWFHVVYHLGLVVLAYVLGRMLHENRTGLAAAAIVAASPLLYVHAGAVLPDNANAFWLTGSTIALLAMRRGAEEKLSSRRRFTGYFVAGVLLGFAYTCKEVTLIMTIPAAVITMTAGPPWRRLAWIRDGATTLLGLVIILLADYLLLRLVSGHWISRLTMVWDTTGYFRDSIVQQGITPLARFGSAKAELEVFIPYTMYLLLAGAFAYGIVLKRNLGFAMTFWWPLLYLTIGPTRLDEYIPPTIQGRYYAILVLPAAVMTAAIAGAIVDRVRETRTGWWLPWLPRLIVALAIVVGLKELWHNLPIAGTLYRANEVKAFVMALEECRERYPKYPIALSSYYGTRMRRGLPLRVQNIVGGPPDGPGPAGPYLYLEQASNVDAVLPTLDPLTHEAHRVFQTFPPVSRGAVLINAIRHMFNVEPQRPLRTSLESSTVVILLTPLPPAGSK